MANLTGRCTVKHPGRRMRLAVAFCATFAFLLGASVFLLSNGRQDAALALGKMSVFLAVPFCYMAFRCLDKVRMRALCFSGAYSLLLCMFTVISSCYMMLDTFVASAGNIVSIVLATPLVAVCVQRFLVFFDAAGTEDAARVQRVTQEGGRQTPRIGCGVVAFACGKLGCFLGFAKAHPVKAFLVVWLAMFALWLPYLFAFWPSVWQFDIHGQSAWLLKGRVLSTWHPVLHTLWVSLPVTASAKLFGSYIPGVAFYTVTQMLVLSALFVKIMTIVARWDISRAVPIVMWLSFALFPVFPFWSMVATKDVVFSGLFALCCACIADLAVRRIATCTHTHTHTHTPGFSVLDLQKTRKEKRESRGDWTASGISFLWDFCFC